MLNRNLHESIMTSILLDIFEDREIGHNLIFKGGTAVYLFYGLDRFSVDLDFNIIDESKIEEIFNKVRILLEKRGKVVDAQIKHFTIFFLLNYGAGNRNLKIEISKRKAKSEFDLLSYYGVEMKVLKKEYMFAYKLVALLDRKAVASRDLFDIEFFLSQGWGIEESIVQDRTGLSLKEYLPKVISFIEKTFTADNILQGLGELLTNEQKDRVKATLKRDALIKLNALQKTIS